MNFFSRSKLFDAAFVALVGAVSAALPEAALAQTYPTKPIRIILPFAPGGGTDISARLLAQPLAQALGQPVIIENRPGAEGVIAGEATMKAAPDGHTLLLGTSSTVSILPAVRLKPPYDSVTDFTSISFVGRFTLFVFINPSVPAKTLAELISYAKANPGKLNFGSSNFFSAVASAQIKSVSGIDMLPVPYKGDGETTTQLMAGWVQLAIVNAMPGVTMTKEGKLRALAVLLPKRSPLLPDVPTMAEAGLPQITIAPWLALLGPAKMPRDIVERISKEFNAILLRPEIREQLERQAFQPEGSTPEELNAFIKEQQQFWRRAAREAGIKPQ